MPSASVLTPFSSLQSRHGKSAQSGMTSLVSSLALGAFLLGSQSGRQSLLQRLGESECSELTADVCALLTRVECLSPRLPGYP